MLTIVDFAKQFVLKSSETLLKTKLFKLLTLVTVPNLTSTHFKMKKSILNNLQTCNDENQRVDFKKYNVTLVACGSFNPITYMHLRMFELAKDFLQEHFSNYVVKSGFISPVGDNYGKPELLCGQHRKEMCQLAVSSSSWIELKTWELEQQDWSPTATVLDHYAETVKHNNFYNKIMLLCGADLLESFSTKDLWLETEIRKIVGHYGIVVIKRPSYNVDEIIQQSPLLTELKDNIVIVSEHFTNDASSTKVRAAIRQKRSIRYVVPDLVADYINKHNLYAEVPVPVADELAPLKKHRSKS